ncbi:cyclin-I2 [Amazona ochrocephala]
MTAATTAAPNTSTHRAAQRDNNSTAPAPAPSRRGPQPIRARCGGSATNAWRGKEGPGLPLAAIGGREQPMTVAERRGGRGVAMGTAEGEGRGCSHCGAMAPRGAGRGGVGGGVPRRPPGKLAQRAAVEHPGPPGSRRLAALLGKALAREERMRKVPVLQNLTLKGTDISLARYRKAVLWIAEMSSLFHFYPETFALATSIFNWFLASVKAQLKYIQCNAISCLVLAAKNSEEDEVIPSVKMLAVQSACKCSPDEILQMEGVILDKLHWDLYTATPMDFLNIFHAMVMSNWPHLLHGLPQRNPSLHVALLTRQLQHCMACHQLLQFKGSTLALVIITLELERQTAEWFPVITDLLKKAQVNSTEFISCKERVDQELMCLQPPNAV